MRQKEVQAVFLGTGTNLAYFSGYPSPSKSGSRPFFLLLPQEGEPIFIVQSGRRAEAQRFGHIRDVRVYAELSRLPVEIIREALGERGALGKRVGMELGFEQSFDVPYVEFRRLKDALPGIELVDASEILWRLRVIKSGNEIACLRAACRILSDAYAAAFSRAREGVTERQIARLLKDHFEDAGAGESFVLITSGKGNYDLATKAPEARPIQAGEMVWVDAGCAVSGYWSDFSRAAVVGRPSPQQVRAQAAIHRITWEAVEQIRPGVTASSIARYCNAHLEGLGLPITSSISGLASRAGHGLGLNVTEPPHIAEYDHSILEPGMVITVEPGVATDYGTFHVEENVLVTPDGHEVLSRAPRTLAKIACSGGFMPPKVEVR